MISGELPLAEGPGQDHERADAARNRRRILQAARALVTEKGIEHVAMTDVAREACVGTGTLYRRFGDRAGLALALLDEREAAFQEQLLRGDPPLGPGAPPAERLHAFGRAYLELLEQHADLIAAAARRGPVVGGPWDAYRMHLLVLLGEAGFAGDAEYAVVSLMEILSPHLHLHLRRDRGFDIDRLTAGWCRLVDSWLGC